MITRETDYAIRALFYLAQHEGGGVVSASVLAETMSIPYRFLRRILGRLVEKGLLTSVRGKQGGLQLAKPPEQVSILDVVAAMDPNAVALNLCTVDPAACTRSTYCVVYDELCRIQAVVNAELAVLSLKTLAVKYRDTVLNTTIR
jgi:Rrf2 family iron-sulfur cluster assembly transcriptional regulator